MDGLKADAARTAGREEARASCDEYGIPVYDAGVLVAEQATADFYETVAKGRDAQARRQLGDRRFLRRA